MTVSSIRLQWLPAILAVASGCLSSDIDRAIVQPADLAFADVTVVDVRAGALIPHQTVLIQQGRIASVGPSATAMIPAGATVITASGRYLIPGLIDAHVHHFEADKGYGDAELPLFLVNGVTTVRVMTGSDAALRARDRHREGGLLAPRLVVCSPHITASHGGATPEEAADLVRRYAARGYDCIKIYSGPTRDAFLAAVRTADSLGIPTAGHAATRLPLDHILRLGSIEHIEELQWFFGRAPLNEGEHGKRLDSLAASGRPIVTTIGGFDFRPYLTDSGFARLLRRESSRYVADEGVRERDAFLEFQRRRQRLVGMDSITRSFGGMYDRALQYAGAFQNRGITLVMGTDAGNSLNAPGFSAHDELEALVLAGLTPAQALAAGTSNAAALLQLDAGRIEPGRLADLVLLRGNPLQDIANLRQIDGVLAGERWLDRNTLDAILIHLRKR